MPVISWKFLWGMIAAVIIFVEGVSLGRPEQGDSLTEVVRLARFDAVGRYVLVPLFLWLVWHWLLRPQAVPMFTWRDLLVIMVAILYVVFLDRRIYG